ncbi:MarR family winged helix-turn-helix transcriptional regulator [Saccharospirillum mangrovi]|uniref:MarR family winged helix-turn-helix transcriptional regulator n=1 Tax=Saccharospirillum mangrovi TaxID=2161747 RepID=UPI000D38C09E|nr:MarR family winged helix-turn-helix transcriptional regulator [Saccharospirillum mangrovi]
MPLLSPEELALWQAIKVLGDEACQAVGRDITAKTSLSGADFAVLSKLDELGDGQLQQRDLLTALGWDKSRLSHQLRRMEDRGLITRSSGPGTVEATLTAAGRTALRATRPVHAAAIRDRALRHIQPQERAALLAVAQRVTQVLSE